MNDNYYRVDKVEGFEVSVLGNDHLSLRLVPELGGRIVSLRDKKSGREWLDGWQEDKGRRLFHPADPLDYASGPFAGVDECLPTVQRCRLGEIELPDHGELWRTEPTFSGDEDGLLCTWNLACLPLSLQRRITLEERKIVLNYCLQNHSPDPVPFLWAWHPLFRLEEGDRLETGQPFSQCRSSEGSLLPWPAPFPGQDLSAADVGTAEPAYAKIFLGPLQDPRVTIHGRKSLLEIEWSEKVMPWVGIWILRGAWNDLHHWAIEPTNAPVDFLSEAIPDRNTLLTAQEKRKWEIQLKFR